MPPPWLPAIKHWSHKCLLRARQCVYPLFERLHFPLSARGKGCLCIGLCTMLVYNSKLDIPHPTSCHPHHVVFSAVQLPVPVCVSWPLASTECNVSAVTSRRCPSHLKPCPHSISSLHLFTPRCILVIFCVVCFGSSSVSRHSHLMAGCSLAHRCCFSYCQSLALRTHTPAPPLPV